ncbi:MAG: glycosyltransferase [Candidatus Omnitrophota bacterium]
MTTFDNGMTIYDDSRASARKINILHVIWSLEKGGAERFLVLLVKNFDQSRFNSIVCCLNWKGEWASELEEKGIKVIALNKKGKFDICVIYRIICVIRQYKIDIVNTHLWAADCLGRVAAIFGGVPIIISTVQNVDIWKKFWHKIIDKMLANRTTKFIAVSKAVKEFLINTEKIPEEKIEIIPNAIDAESLRVNELAGLRVREDLGIKNEEIVLTVIGRLVEQKGHKYLFEALSMLDGRYRVKLLVVGDGPLRESLQFKVNSLQLENKIQFLGQRRDMAEIFNASDGVILPSLYEGLPVSILEAMAVGKPVIATDVGGTCELVKDGETGFLAQAKNSKSLASNIEKLLTSPDKGKKMGERGKELVNNAFSIQAIVKKTADLYLSLLGNG